MIIPLEVRITFRTKLNSMSLLQLARNAASFSRSRPFIMIFAKKNYILYYIGKFLLYIKI